MPIQFRCPACGQPVEVDAEAAGQMVQCPFCSKVAAAPSESDSMIRFNVPVATPQPTNVGLPAGARTAIAGPSPHRAAALGRASLIAAAMAILCTLLAVLALVPMVAEMDPNAGMAENQRFLQERAEGNTLILGLATIGGIFAPLVGLVLGVLALMQQVEPKWPAVVGSAVSVMLALMTCMGAFVNMSMNSL